MTKWLHSYIKHIKTQWLLGLFFISISALCFVIFSYYIASFFYAFFSDKTYNISFLLYASVSFVLKYIFTFLANKNNNKAGDCVVINMKNDIIIPLLHNLKIAPQNGVDYYNRLTEETKAYFSSFIPSALASVVVGFICLVIFFSLDKFVGIVMLLSLVLIPLQMVAVGYGAESIHNKHLKLFLEYANIFYNRTLAISGINNLGNVKQQYNFIKEKSDELSEATMKVMKVAMLSSAMMELFITFSIAIVAIYLGLGLLGYSPNTLDKGYDYLDALFILLLTPYYYVYFRKFVAAYHDRSRALASAEILNHLEIPTTLKTETKHQNIEKISLKNISFAYEGDQNNVLDNISYTFPRTGFVLIKGISGSGKSTLLKIISGYLSPQIGEIINQKSEQLISQILRDISVYMNQHPYIFDGTLRYNIELNTPLSEQELQYIIEKSHLKKIIEKKKDLEVELFNNGINLSGGERQLISFSRLLAHKKQIIVLDEPTSSLDEDTSKKIIQTLKELSTQHLIIVASHQELFEEVADETFTLNWGQIFDHAN